ncbi:hypothetical protein LPJ53_000002 [Coemansia erecta]|uniref:Uncharacterized protein n=1 Tax=Coemansia erecta TaxID=147472 RepID=A0A9W8CVH7_9FUNG|nr:hypothetical protein LPJ53_000002 [Coemansia erecta]
MSQVQRPPRRRLFTRRELRHRGTHIVRVGSVNIVQSAQGPYSFAAVAQRYNSSEASQDGSAPPPNEPIEAFSQRSSSAERHERAEDIIDSDLGRYRHRHT